MGALTGLLYIGWAFIISGIFGGGMPCDTVLLSDILLGIVVGAIGGVIGINIGNVCYNDNVVGLIQKIKSLIYKERGANVVQARLEELNLPDILTFNDGNRVKIGHVAKKKSRDYSNSRKSGLWLFAASAAGRILEYRE